jgi:hypothetical protein
LVDEVWCDLPSDDPAWRDVWLATAHRGARPPKTGPLMTSFDEQIEYALAGAGISVTARLVDSSSAARASPSFPSATSSRREWRSPGGEATDSALVARFVALAAEVRDREAAAGRLRAAKVAPPELPIAARRT